MARVGPEEPVVSVGPAVLVVWVVLVVLVDRVAPVATGPPLFQPRAVLGKMDSATGRTTPCIAAGHLIRTGLRQIGSGVPRAVIHLPDGRPVPGNRLPDRVES